MEFAIAYGFRFVMYTFFGLTLETVFAVDGIERALGYKLTRRVPAKYLEGFVSLYMIPLHGLGLLFLFEPIHALIAGWFWGLRYCVYALLISSAEVLWGVLLHKVIGFYTWDYYAKSRYKVFKNGYTLWTLIPLWGLVGMILEVYSDLMIYLSQYVVIFFAG